MPSPLGIRRRIRQLVPGGAEGLGVRDVFGLRPLRPALEQSWRAIRGSGDVPPTKFGLSSVKIFKPQISLPTWLGQRRPDRKAWVYNLVNRDAPPPDEAFSVRVTRVRDFRGGELTYDTHRGTDFAVPVGTPIITPAPGVVADVRVDMDRGGRKVCIDHGAGLFTTLNHLARTTVRPGQQLARGQVIGLSGMSGLDGALFFPWVAPHVHLNVLLDGEFVDPFATSSETPLWVTGDNRPRGFFGEHDDELRENAWHRDNIEETIARCSDDALREHLQRLPTLEERGRALMVFRVLRGAVFDEMRELYHVTADQPALLDLPFLADDVPGVAFPEEPPS
jgi:murein DD-endopeptidase MepM/ murein hydrolase activator NlpD